MTRAVRRATAEGDAPGATAAAALASRPVKRRGPASREAGECWSLRLTPEERRNLGEELETLTDREREVALAICDGGSNEAVAERMYIALPTLRTHLMRINQKLGTRSKGDVVRLMVGRLLDAYRAGRIGHLPTPTGAAGSPSQTLSNGRSATLAETKPMPMTDRAPPNDFQGEALGNGESAGRPGLARPKIIGIDDDNRAEAARMAGSL